MMMLRLRPAHLAGVLVVGAFLPAQILAQQIEVTRAADGTMVLISKPASYSRSSYTATLPDRWPYHSLIHHYSRKAGLDPKLVASVIQIESAFRSNALSDKGAQGLMQLMPATATELGVEDVWDPAENIRGGTQYLRAMLDRFGTVELALAGYNAGPTAVAKYGSVPPYQETTDYVDKILRLYKGRGFDKKVSRPANKPVVRPMRPVFVTRDADKGIVLTTRH